MRDFFDTSVLVAFVDASEVGHKRSLRAVQSATQPLVSKHSLAELFATLTGRRGFPAEQAARLVRTNCLEAMKTIDLTAGEYLDVMERSRGLGVRGGSIYDALILAAARKSRAERIFTLNLEHFRQFAPDLREIIMEP